MCLSADLREAPSSKLCLRSMPLFLTTLRAPSSDHRVAPVDEGFFILPVAGRETQFDTLARKVIDHDGAVASFGRKNGDGLYDCVFILPLG